VIEAFEQLLATQDSATEALAQWCAARGLAAQPAITARRLAGDLSLPPGARAMLGASAGEPVTFRHVQLVCGALVLSEARNWYIPSRLTPEMNRLLATTDRPFGAVIAPLRFRRERIDSVHGAGPGCPVGTILTNRAMIRKPDGVALALVVECYQPALLGGK
jgi:hypothetical protein